MDSAKQKKNYFSASFDTPLGEMIGVADENILYILDFLDRPGLNDAIDQLQATIIAGKTKPLLLIEQELRSYFVGQLVEFKTPCSFLGTLFQQSVWQQLQKIPYGKTSSYLELANNIAQPRASCAVGQANGKNRLSIIIPCH